MATEIWPLPESWAFGPFVRDRVRMVAEDAGSDGLYMQQRFCRSYLAHEGPYRGLLLYHGLGSGKSCSAIATAEALRAAAGRRVYVLLPAALRNNYVAEVRRCGGRVFQESQRWTRVPVPDTMRGKLMRSRSAVSTDLGKGRAGWIAAVGTRLAGLHGVVWVPEAADGVGGGVAFESLRPSEQDQVRQQVDAAVVATHRFIHYNGLNAASMRALIRPGEANPFDDSVVVIDEVHNFVSNLDGGKLVGDLYRRILGARRSKVMLLSGTPLINAPEEIAWIVNLAAGPQVVFDVPYPHGLTDAEAEARAMACLHVTHAYEHLEPGRSRSLRLHLAPEGFVRVHEGGADRVVKSPGATEESALTAALSSLGIPKGATRAARREFELLPSDPERFRSAFVDVPNNRLVNADVLVRRCVGAVSYFRGHDPSAYPSIRSQYVNLPLSSAQFTEYTTQRVAERRREDAARRAKAVVARGGVTDGGDSINVRQFSRSSCTFVFPPGIVRPRRADVAADGEESVDHAYQAALDAAIGRLGQSPELLKLDEGLAELSPKFNAITRELLESEGPAIVYSEFRRAEGVAVLSVALEANGFAQLEVARTKDGLVMQLKLNGSAVASPSAAQLAMPRYAHYSNDDAECATALLAVFNGQLGKVPPSVRNSPVVAAKGNSNISGDMLRALLITQSGAEGISTLNVRKVLIVEPFWHFDRLGQVIGRARRAHSHDELPQEKRLIDVRIYVAVMTPEQAKRHRADQGQTSDQYVLGVAERKRQLIQPLLGVLKRAAVDCEVSQLSAERDGGTTCEVDASADGDSDGVWRRQTELERDLAARRRLKLVAVNVPGRGRFYWDRESGTLYDYGAMKRRGDAVEVGRLTPRAR